MLQCPRAGAAWSIDRVVAPYRYAEPLNTHVQALKFAHARRLGRALGELLALELVAGRHYAAVDVLVPVPLHRSRLLERGYNQAIELARPVAAAVRRPLLVAGVVRRRATPAQAQLAAGLRRKNVRNAFRVSSDLAGLRVAIVDDVLTTGATIDALAHALKTAGSVAVDAWALARSL